MPGIDDLLLATALDPALCRRAIEAPGEVLADYDLTAEELDIVRSRDERMLGLLARAAPREPSAPAADPPEPPPAGAPLHTFELVVSVTPCEQNGVVSYAVWVQPLAAGVEPASLPEPAGATYPGTPLTPLRAVLQISAVRAGAQIGLWAALRQSTNLAAR